MPNLPSRICLPPLMTTDDWMQAQTAYMYSTTTYVAYISVINKRKYVVDIDV